METEKSLSHSLAAEFARLLLDGWQHGALVAQVPEVEAVPGICRAAACRSDWLLVIRSILELIDARGLALASTADRDFLVTIRRSRMVASP